jgi:Protein of unknown function (DUF1566)
MNKFLNSDRPSRFLKPGRSLLLLMLFVFCTAAFATPTTPTADFIDNNDGTVTHKTTGLVWMRCSMGQTWDKATANCTGTAATYPYAQAMSLTSTFASHSDWRLPNIAELQTIIERENYNPAINVTMFPNAPTGGSWSSSPNAYHSELTWFMNLSNGSGGGYNGNYDFLRAAVRLVRAGQSFGFLPLITPTADFTDNNDGSVTHKRTGLVWQRCSVGQTWTGTTCSGVASGYTWNAAMALTSTFAGYNDWRVPNQNELLSIAEYGAYNPAINIAPFPNTPTGGFWSSSPSAYSIHSAWIVNFNEGVDSSMYEGYSLAVRLVRGRWANVVANSPNLPDGTIAGDTKGWVNLLSFGNTLGSYMGVTAYMNNADGLGVYQSTDLAFRFAKNILHLTKPAKPAGKNLAAANKDKAGYIVLNGTRTNIIAKYYPTRSTIPPVNGSIISQTSSVVVYDAAGNPRKPGHVSIAKKIVKINDNTLDVYLFEQNWIAGSLIADSRKMRFTRNAAGEWTGKTTLRNKAVGWLNPEIK